MDSHAVELSLSRTSNRVGLVRLLVPWERDVGVEIEGRVEFIASIYKSHTRKDGCPPPAGSLSLVKWMMNTKS